MDFELRIARLSKKCTHFTAPKPYYLQFEEFIEIKIHLSVILVVQDSYGPFQSMLAKRIIPLVHTKIEEFLYMRSKFRFLLSMKK